MWAVYYRVRSGTKGGAAAPGGYATAPLSRAGGQGARPKGAFGEGASASATRRPRRALFTRRRRRTEYADRGRSGALGARLMIFDVLIG